MPYPGQTNAFTLILNVNKQVDIYLSFSSWLTTPTELEERLDHIK